MSGIPTPANRQGVSRLPAPKSTSMQPPSAAGNKLKRASSDLEQSLAKKERSDLSDKSTTSSSVRFKSTISRVNKPLPNSMMTGRATLAGTRPGLASTSRTATKRPLNTNTKTSSGLKGVMNDRTNLANQNGRQGNGSQPAKKSKRPAWDVKGRLEDMEALFAATNERVASLENQNNVLKTNVAEKETVVVQSSEELSKVLKERAELESQLGKVKEELKIIRDKSEEDIRKLNSEKQDLEFRKSSLERQIQTLESDLRSKIEEISGLKMTVSQLTSGAAKAEAELKTTKDLLDEAKTQISELTKLSNDQHDKIVEFEAQFRAAETERRRLHNTIQELKGNIRVFCRVRPLLKSECAGDGSSMDHIKVGSEKSLSLTKNAGSPNESVASGLKGKDLKYDFEFDRVFSPEANQNQVFEEISQLVQSVIDGYNVCVFAYGQTGSGKTFTMEGGDDESQEGMIPRSIKMIFNETERLVEKGWSYKLEANFLEIYNEEIRDLLTNDKNLKHEIKLVKEGDVVYSTVSNIKVESVTSPGQIAQLIQRAKKNRAVAATNCNERSSRSHSIFQLKVVGENSITTESCSGVLNLVDLAGSERLKESGSEGTRLVETKSINKSLANLGNVIMALANKDQHVPYRNSKLTHLLQGSLGGNSKTLMFVNISPREDSFSETLNSLRFATKVNQCQIGTATKKIK